MSEESDGYEAVLIDAGFLTLVLAKHRKVFDSSREWLTREKENLAFLPSETHDLNDEEVRKA